MHGLYKDKKNRMLGGVCAGIADYTGFDVTLIRAFTVIITLTFTPLISVYFLLLLILPDKDESLGSSAGNIADLMASLKKGSGSAYAKTAMLIAVGAVIIFILTETFFHVDLKLKYIIIFTSIIFGLYLITTKDLYSDPSKRVITGTAVCIFTLLWLASSTGFLYFPIAIIVSTFAGIWPLLLAAFGVSLLLQNKRHIFILWLFIAFAVLGISMINAISVFI